jgi:hypothetical protein
MLGDQAPLLYDSTDPRRWIRGPFTANIPILLHMQGLARPAMAPSGFTSRAIVWVHRMLSVASLDALRDNGIRSCRSLDKDYDCIQLESNITR